MPVYQYPALNDNYHFVIYCDNKKTAAAVDICDPKPLFDFLDKNKLKLEAVFNTHHHYDHVGGNEEIKKKFQNVSFFGSKYDFERKRIPCQNKLLSEGDVVRVGDIEFKVFEIPGHTLGHIAYINKAFCFVGDTLFGAGCGRLFEGSPKQMVESIKKIISNITYETKIYCAHEYTVSNLNFASSINSDYFEDSLEKKKIKRLNGEFTVPLSLKEELNFNPFLMVLDHSKSELLGYKQVNVINNFADLRLKKDNF